MNTQASRFFEAIDPLFLIFPEHIAVILSELLHPHVELVAKIEKVLRSLPPDQLAVVATRVQVMGPYVNATQEALKNINGQAVRKTAARVGQ